MNAGTRIVPVAGPAGPIGVAIDRPDRAAMMDNPLSVPGLKF